MGNMLLRLGIRNVRTRVSCQYVQICVFLCVCVFV